MWAWVKKHPFGFLAAVLGAIVITVVLFSSVMNRASCKLYGGATERETRYSIVVGCMVQTKSGWVPRGEIRTAAE